MWSPGDFLELNFSAQWIWKYVFHLKTVFRDTGLTFFPSPFWNTFITICVRNLSANYSTLDHIYSRWEKKIWHHCSGGINLILRQALKTGQIYHHPREELICLHQLQRKPRDKQPPFQAVRADESYPRRWSVTPPGWAVTGTLLGRASGLSTRKGRLSSLGRSGWSKGVSFT